MNQLTVTLPKFEGPLDLLLYLIRKEEMDIFDIKIHEITRQYLEYIKRMRELDLEVAGEFISMASTLIHIKSRMLLPQYNDQGEIIESEDPRKELVQRLLERGKTSGRPDDQDEEKIRNRYDEYNQKTAPLMQYYQAQGKFHAVNGIGSIEEITVRLSAVIDSL